MVVTSSTPLEDWAASPLRVPAHQELLLAVHEGSFYKRCPGWFGGGQAHHFSYIAQKAVDFSCNMLDAICVLNAVQTMELPHSKKPSMMASREDG